MHAQCHIGAAVRHVGLELSGAQELGCAGGVPGRVVVDARLRTDLHGRKSDRTAPTVTTATVTSVPSMNSSITATEPYAYAPDHGRRKFSARVTLLRPSAEPQRDGLTIIGNPELVTERPDQDEAPSSRNVSCGSATRVGVRRPRRQRRSSQSTCRTQPAGRTDRADEWHAQQVEHLAQCAVLTSFAVQDREDDRASKLCEPSEQGGVNIGPHDLEIPRERSA